MNVIGGQAPACASPVMLADSLELPAHIHLCGVEVDVCPWQSEDFAQAQAEDQR